MKSLFSIISCRAFLSLLISHLPVNTTTGMPQQMKRDIFS